MTSCRKTPLTLDFEIVPLIVCWWWDDVDLLDDAAHGVYLIPKLLAGETERFTSADGGIAERTVTAVNPSE